MTLAWPWLVGRLVQRPAMSNPRARLAEREMSHCERRNEGEGKKQKRALPKSEEAVGGCRRLPGSLRTVWGG